MFSFTFLTLCLVILLNNGFVADAYPANTTQIEADHGLGLLAPPNCFPAVGFEMPRRVPTSLADWWCPSNTEYGFVGFSYEITACQDVGQLRTDFLDIRKKFHGRYVRLYGFCDRPGYYNNVVEAAWDAGIGVFALIWFGFDGGNEWIGRRDALFSTLHSNPKAKFVTRALQFGSEPLFDSALEARALAKQVRAAKDNLASLQIPVTVSDFAYTFGSQHGDGGGPEVLGAVDVIAAHVLPFFSTEASTASKAWPIIKGNLDPFIAKGNNKKIWFTENGWPSVTGGSISPNSPKAVANVQNERDYYALLDQHCTDLKAVPGGGVGWFAHIYSDAMEPGYGIYDASGNLKFPFSPRTRC